MIKTFITYFKNSVFFFSFYFCKRLQIKKTQKQKGKVYIVGNGGSSSIASHVSVDFAKVARVNSSTFNNANLITCFANDYGYENWVSKALEFSFTRR